MGDTACCKCYARIQTQPTELTRTSPHAKSSHTSAAQRTAVQHGELGPAATQAAFLPFGTSDNQMVEELIENLWYKRVRRYEL